MKRPLRFGRSCFIPFLVTGFVRIPMEYFTFLFNTEFPVQLSD